jgi:hypothetical protein
VATMVVRAGVASRMRNLSLLRAVLVASGVLAGLGTGLMLVVIASAFGRPTVDFLIVIFSAVLIAAAAVSDRPWQIDYETPPEWLLYGDWRTAALNGGALGLGFLTRLGYWGWYAVPLATLAAPSLAWAVATPVAYALARVGLSAYVTPLLPDEVVVGRRQALARVLDPATAFVFALLAAEAVSAIR